MKKIGITVFIAFILLIASSFVYIFFGNQGQVELSIKGRDQMLKELSVTNDDLKRARVAERDSVHKLHTVLVKNDSLIITQDKKIKKGELEKQILSHKVDSLSSILKKIQLSDIQPVKN